MEGRWRGDHCGDQGKRTTPSYVVFTDTEPLIGDAAKNQVVRDPENAIFVAKRLIGRKFVDPIVQAEVISTMSLVRMKETTEAHDGEKVSDVVVTVPWRL